MERRGAQREIKRDKYGDRKSMENKYGDSDASLSFPQKAHEERGERKRHIRCGLIIAALERWTVYF